MTVNYTRQAVKMINEETLITQNFVRKNKAMK